MKVGTKDGERLSAGRREETRKWRDDGGKWVEKKRKILREFGSFPHKPLHMTIMVVSVCLCALLFCLPGNHSVCLAGGTTH